MLNSIIELNRSEINHISGGTGEPNTVADVGFDIKLPTDPIPAKADSYPTVLDKAWGATKTTVWYGYQGCVALSTALVLYTFGKQLYRARHPVTKKD